MKLLPLLALAAVAPLYVLTSTPGTAATPPAPELANYEVDGGHSSVVFRIQHFVAPFWGRFNEVAGKLEYDAKAPEKSKVEISIDAASVDTADEKRDEHLRGPDFFSAKEFPAITFKSTSVKKKGDKLEVAGEMTMRGKSKAVTAEVTVVGEGDTLPQMGYRAGFEATFEIKRSDFGVSGYLPKIGDDVRIIVALECARK